MPRPRGGKNEQETHLGESAVKKNSSPRGSITEQGPDGAGLASHIFALLQTHVHRGREGEYAHAVM